MGAYASAEYVAAYGMPKGPADYPKHRFVGPDDRENRAPYFQWLSKHVPDQAVTFRCTDSRAAEAAVIAGAGIGFLPEGVRRALPDLVEIHPPREEWSAPVWLVTHVDLHRTTKVQALLNFIKDYVREGAF